MASKSPIGRRTAIVLLIVCLVAVAGLGQTTSPKKTAKKKSTAAAATKRPASRTPAHTRSAAASHDQSSSGSSRAQARKVVVTRKLIHGKWVRTTQIVRPPPGPSYQTHPDQERYQQIQQALAQKGYFKGEVNGQWGDDSVEAMKRFQTEHKLSNDGKISSLSLMGLGLGPTRETAAVRTETVPAGTQSEQPHE